MIGKIYWSVFPYFDRKACYVRTHKQTIVHQAALTTLLGDMKKNYEELYLEIISKLEQFNKEIIEGAL